MLWRSHAESPVALIRLGGFTQYFDLKGEPNRLGEREGERERGGELSWEGMVTISAHDQVFMIISAAWFPYNYFISLLASILGSRNVGFFPLCLCRAMLLVIHMDLPMAPKFSGQSKCRSWRALNVKVIRVSQFLSSWSSFVCHIVLPDLTLP